MNFAILAFALGVGLTQLAPRLPSQPLGGAVALLLTLLATGFLIGRRLGPARGAWRLSLLMLWSLAFGLAWAAWLAQGRLAEQLPEALEGVDIPVTGVVAALPQEFPRGLRFEFSLDASQSVEGQRLPGRILLSYYGTREVPPPSLEPGQRWQFTVRLKRPHGNANPHGFDYEGWLLERDLRATGYVRSGAGEGAPRLLGQERGFLLGIEQLRLMVRERFQRWLPETEYPYAGILTALAVGDQRAIPGDQWRAFARTGTTHLMSVSGLHITLVAALGAAAAGWLWRRWPRLLLRCPARWVEIFAGWLVAGAYTLLAGAAVPALRTLAMLTAAALALLSGRVADAGQVLCFALLAVLLYDPWAFLSPGFWLSFVAVAALLLLSRDGPSPEPRHGAASGKGRGRELFEWSAAWWARLRQAAPGHLARWGAAQWAASLGTLPLLLLFFQQFSLVSPLANAVAIPLVSLVVTPLALGAAVLPLPFLAQLAHALLAVLMVLLDWLAAWPGAVWSPPAPGPTALLLACLGTAWLLLPRGFPGRWLGAVLLLPLATEAPPRPGPGEAWVTVLDVGQGLAAAVRTQGHTLLYDSGPYYSAESDAGQRIVVPWLRAEGVDHLDGLILTHRDTDHSGGARSVLESVAVGWVADSLENTPEGRALAGLAQQRRRCFAGQTWEWDGVRFSILHPAWEDYAADPGKANHMSCVLRLEAGGQSVLLASDIEAPDEAAMLLRDRAALKSQVLLVPHHGSRTSSTPEFIQAVGAGEVIFPVGYRNRFGHPKADVVQRYGEAHQWRTDRDGAITINLGPAGTVLRSEREEGRRYWHGQ